MSLHCASMYILHHVWPTSLIPRLFGVGTRLPTHRKLNQVIAPASECIHVWPELWKGWAGAKDDNDCNNHIIIPTQQAIVFEGFFEFLRRSIPVFSGSCVQNIYSGKNHLGGGAICLWQYRQWFPWQPAPLDLPSLCNRVWPVTFTLLTILSTENNISMGRFRWDTT